MNAQISLIRFAKDHATKQRDKVDGYLKEQFQARMDKATEGRKKNLNIAMETYIDALFCLKLYHSPRRWRSAAQARREFAMLPSDARRLVVAKQQLLMYANGLEIEGAHHPWSKDKHTYTGYELLEWIINTVMPLAKELDRKGQLPMEPTVRMKSLPAVPCLGTTSDLPVGGVTSVGEEMDKFRAEYIEEFGRRVADGRFDLLSEKTGACCAEKRQEVGGVRAGDVVWASHK